MESVDIDSHAERPVCQTRSESFVNIMYASVVLILLAQNVDI